MKTNFNIQDIIQKKLISNELEYERAMLADRKLRLLSKNDSYFKEMRNKLRDIIEQYESTHWESADKITEEQLIASEKAEKTVDYERNFIENRKIEIRTKLKKFNLTQQDLAQILGHKSHTHMSELINGLKPFTLHDLVIISHVLKINLMKLIPTIITPKEYHRIKSVIDNLDKPNLKFNEKDFISA